MLRPRYLATGWLLMWVLPACSGAVSEDVLEGPDDTPGQHGSGDAGATNNPTPVTPTVNTPPSELPSPVAPTPPAPGEVTRMARLTHAQYANTVADLFGIEDITATFPPDARNGFEFSSSLDFVVDGRMAPQYQTVAETIASTVVTDDAVFAKVVPCSDETQTCRDRFIAEFGLRSFRRPLSDAEQMRLAELFDAGAELVGGSSPFRDGVQVVVEALMQSPYFLYRTELSNTTEDATVPLSNYEVASRLSYFLYDSMPDAELFAAAAAGELTNVSNVEAQVERMLQTDAATAQLVSFHEQAWHFDRYSKVSPDPAVFPDLADDLSSRLLDASRAFVTDVIESGGGVSELLTAPFAYADTELGRLYGIDVEGQLQRIELDSGSRLGLLSQPGFLASHAHARKTDPIHRGLFVTRDLLCRSIGAPPAGASMATLPEGSPTPKTTREEVTLLTAPSGCVECHRLINPPGFAFEGFDAVGQIRDEEDGTPVDTATTILLDGVELEVSGAVELVQHLAESGEVHACYADKWLTFAHGRTLERDEIEDPDRFRGPMSTRELVTLIATDAPFLTRPTTQVSP